MVLAKQEKPERYWVIQESSLYVSKYMVKAKTRAEALRRHKNQDDYPEEVEWIGYMIADNDTEIIGMDGPFDTPEQAYDEGDTYVDTSYG